MNPAIRSIVLTTALALSGCATTNPKDPLESFNRVIFTFNDTVDQAAVKPAAQLYSTLPTFVQTGVGNFFGNLDDVGTAINNFLQGKAADGLSDVMRVAVNSTMGLGGILDIGTEAGLQKHKEDFGQTLGKWGVKAGPYIVLPLFGSSTLRDTIALPVDLQAEPWYYVRPVHVRNPGSVLRAVDQRAAVLEASNLIEEAALDRYIFVRDAYMQRRESKVRDGESPSSSYEDDVGPTLSGMEVPDLNQKAAAAVPASEADTEPKAKPVVKVEQNGIVDLKSTVVGTETKQ